MVNRLRFGWWNTNLSPTKLNGQKSKESDLEATLKVIKLLLTDYSCDLVGLCEVDAYDIAYINNNLNLSDTSIIDLVEMSGRSRFDMAVVYNDKKVSIEKERQLSETVTGNTLKVAQILNASIVANNSSIRLYLCHWASKMYGDGMAKRDVAAQLLYSDCKTDLQDGSDVIVMGDFNANPYDNCLVNNLRASRCHEAVKLYPKEFFYNPFWRSVVSSKRYGYLMNDAEFMSGSYRYKEFNSTVWHSLDQIILSGSFLNGSRWQLNEFFTNVLYHDSFYDGSGKKQIDHFPVVCEVTESGGNQIGL